MWRFLAKVTARGESEGDPSGGSTRRWFLKGCSQLVLTILGGLGLTLIERRLPAGPGPLLPAPPNHIPLTGSATLSLHATADITLGALTVMATGTACGPSDSTLTV